MKGRVNGENIREFIGPDLASQVPGEIAEGPDVIGSLVARFGEAEVIGQLVARFYELGDDGTLHTEHSWQRFELDTGRRTALGLGLQHVLSLADQAVESAELDYTTATVTIGRAICQFKLDQINGETFTVPVQ